MLSLMCSLHAIASTRGDGLRPEFFRLVSERAPRKGTIAAYLADVLSDDAGNLAKEVPPRVRA